MYRFPGNEIRKVWFGRASCIIAALAVYLATIVANAQVRYTPPVQQDGRLFDANPQIGSGGYNYARPVSPLSSGNLTISGNVRGGRAFRGFSPISSTTAFRGPLGSGTLSAFRRDSVSMADRGSVSVNTLGTPYYDPAQTAYTSDFLSRASGQYQYNQPSLPIGTLSNRSRGSGHSLGVAGPLDLRLDPSLKFGPAGGTAAKSWNPTSLQSQIVGLTPDRSSELSSSIFGPMAQTAPTGEWNYGRPRTSAMAGLPTGTESWDPLGHGMHERMKVTDPPGTRPPLGTPLELVRSSTLRRITPAEGEELFAPPGSDAQFYLGPIPADMEAEEGIAVPPVASEIDSKRVATYISDASVLPGYDVFNDMQLSLSLSADLGAAWFNDMQAAIRENPELVEMLHERSQLESQEFVDQMLNSPIKTFHGEGDSPLNNELLKAESLLEIGQYYEAARRYQAAHRLNPLNPLPLIGKGNAFLAAGNYASSTVALLQGFERYPELVEFSFDLTELIGGREIVDIRRADIMRLLEGRDDPHLRFLLGYLEYYAGDRESGMTNLERAAELDQSGSIISRFPKMLRQEGTLPPPKLPESLPPMPEKP